MAPRTFKIQNPRMRGTDVKEWQEELLRIGKTWGIQFPLKANGVYGMATRSFSKMILFGRGYPYSVLAQGITPKLRSETRHPELRPKAVKERANTSSRREFRDNLRMKFDGDEDVAAPISKILTMSWGWHPPTHDGIDLICGPNAPLYAICDGRVIDVRAGGWWGNNPTGDVWKGDGIIQLECLTDEGPFKKGMHIGYGHAEHANVKVGQKVEAGTRIGLAGLANAWHTHLMGNWGKTMRGIGEFDPRPLVEYAIAND